MKQIIISPEKDDVVQVCIMDPVRGGDKNIFFCPLGSIYDIIKVNINSKF